MAKTRRTIINEEKRKEVESPAHRKRREQEARLRDVVRHQELKDEYDDIETFEKFTSQRRSS